MLGLTIWEAVKARIGWEFGSLLMVLLIFIVIMMAVVAWFVVTDLIEVRRKIRTRQNEAGGKDGNQ